MSESERLNDRERRAWFAFLTMQEDLRRHLNRQLLHDAEISLADFAVLSTLRLAQHGPMRVFELRDALRWEKTRVIHQVSRMIRRGLLERQTCVEDRRGTRIALTDEGRAVIDKATPLHLRYVRQIFLDVLSPRQLDTLAAVSETVLENLEDELFED
ncbi:MarR family winged helix-turn-helix transcriptional regulator [Plantactinospora sp. WMMC1484]|uniref:MarR family winged helix-turn-helix transcriptional regulator n=1 Tax=Plantactinospora sp. WMMC1484 TaxID=3404122 RepID=UPI003BF4F637